MSVYIHLETFDLQTSSRVSVPKIVKRDFGAGMPKFLCQFNKLLVLGADPSFLCYDMYCVLELLQLCLKSDF